jgi:hypothetical protein
VLKKEKKKGGNAEGNQIIRGKDKKIKVIEK